MESVRRARSRYDKALMDLKTANEHCIEVLIEEFHSSPEVQRRIRRNSKRKRGMAEEAFLRATSALDAAVKEKRIKELKLFE